MNFSDASINKIVTNLPFGRQISFGEKTNEMNRQILYEITRVLVQQGIAVVLSENWDEIKQEAESMNLALIDTYPLSLKGLHPIIFVFQKF
jgi:tRNA (guanine6-N2)-methyltransferase